MRSPRGDGARQALALSHGAEHKGMAAASVGQHGFHRVHRFKDPADGIQVGFRAADAIGHRAGRTGGIQAHERLAAFLPDLQAGIHLLGRIVEADDISIRINAVTPGRMHRHDSHAPHQ